MPNFHAVEVEGCECPETLARCRESNERISSLIRALRKPHNWAGRSMQPRSFEAHAGVGDRLGTLMINVMATPGPSILTLALSQGGGIYLEVLSSKLFRKRV